MTLTIHDCETGEPIELPAHYEVCPRCRGAGACDQPEFDGGFTPEMFADDPDFAGHYLAGHYDVLCPECRGKRVVVEVTMRDLTGEQRELWRRHEDARVAERREARMRARGIQW